MGPGSSETIGVSDFDVCWTALRTIVRPQYSEVSSLVPDEACHCAATGGAWNGIEEPRKCHIPVFLAQCLCVDSVDVFGGRRGADFR